MKKIKILHLGCGINKIPEALGIDINKKAIKHTKSISMDIIYILSDARSVPFKNNYFDSVYSIEVLEHTDNPGKILKEVNRVLKKGGIFYLTTSLEGEPKNLYYRLNKKLGFNAHEEMFGHVQHFSLIALESLLRNSGFKIITQKYTYHYINQIYRFVSTKYLEKFLPSFFVKILNFVFSFITGFESFILRNSVGLDIQVICLKS